MKRDSFIFYASYKTSLDYLPHDKQLEYLCAIIDYALDGVEPNMDGAVRACFELIRPVIEKNNRLYENGKKGGAPKGNQNAPKTQSNPNEQPNNNQILPKNKRKKK